MIDKEATATFFQAINEHNHYLVKHYLDAGISPNDCFTDHEKSEPAIIVALRAKNDLALTLLIKRGAKLHLKNSRGETPLIVATSNHQLSFMKKLIKSGAASSIDTFDSMGQNALMVAAEHGYQKGLKLLVKHGANVNFNNDNRTPLLSAINNKQLNCIEILLKNGANINGTNSAKTTPLICGAAFGYTEIVTALIDAGADIDYIGYKSMTALMHAADSNKLDTVKLIIAAGADLSIVDDRGFDALTIAKSRHYTDIIQYLSAYIEQKKLENMIDNQDIIQQNALSF